MINPDCEGCPRSSEMEVGYICRVDWFEVNESYTQQEWKQIRRDCDETHRKAVMAMAEAPA